MPLPKKIFAAEGATTTFFGPGRKEFNPKVPMRSFEEYLKETAEGTCSNIDKNGLDEGIIANFMAERFIEQGHLGAFLPFMVPELKGKPCTSVEGACCSGGRAVAMAVRSVLSGLSKAVFVAGFEIQNSVKSVYGADILAGAAYYNGERKGGFAHFFPGIFAARAGAYYERYGYKKTRQAMAKWHELAIFNARKNPKAQEYHNQVANLFEEGMTAPCPERFLPHINLYDCSKVTDGAASIIIASEEGLKKCGINKTDAIEIISLGEAEGDITEKPQDLTALTTTELAVKKAFDSAGVDKDSLALLEIHDCFSITALLAFEAIGFAKKGEGAHFILEEGPLKVISTNLSGGLSGFGHPTGATGVRQLVDLQLQLTGQAANQAAFKNPYGMMVNMGGNDKTVTAAIVRSTIE